jgi:hypothetical protein
MNENITSSNPFSYENMPNSFMSIIILVRRSFSLLHFGGISAMYSASEVHKAAL